MPSHSLLGAAPGVFTPLPFLGFGTAVRQFLSLRIFYPIAQLSYSIYLFDMFFIMGTYDTIIGQGMNPSLVELVMMGIPAMIFGTVVICTGSYVFLEKPFMNL
ncbi:MAG: hypothetical protein VYA34_13455 [Myxococcota bacterium]|nr:hypothetical protein [Myxococcota bacterium]